MSSWRGSLAHGFLGMALGFFAGGVYRHGVVRLSLAFLFLASAWAYREMDLGWDADKKSWKFVQAPVKSKTEYVQGGK